MRYLIRTLLGLLISLSVLIFGGISVVIAFLYTTLPQVDGIDDVEHLSLPSSIRRDIHGVPHIQAENISDAYFSLGYTHAQDRLWQMHLLRMLASGRLSEVFGEKVLPNDELARALGRPEQARRAFDSLNPQEKALINSYAAGVNAYLRSPRYRTPPEFMITWSTPQPWTPMDSMYVSIFFNFLGTTYDDELRSLHLAYTGGSTLAESFQRPYPVDGHTSLQIEDLIATMGPSIQGQTRTSTPTTTVNEAAQHSNNWVISGERSASGGALLANDPHLRMSTPGLWYLAHIQYADHNLTGATLPGLPFVIIGHNQHVAWGFTTTVADIEDIVIEQLHPEDTTKYQTPGGWKTFSSRQETINIRGRSPVSRTYHLSEHGRILPFHLLNDIYDGLSLPPNTALAYQTTADIGPNHSARFFHRLNEARTWKDVVAAAPYSGIPPHNMVVATRDGDIGYIMLGKIPVRADNHPSQGSHPTHGKDPWSTWKGLIPPEGMPKVVNPNNGYIVTANGRIVPPDFIHTITASWESPGRAPVIEKNILAQHKHTLDSLEKMQLDVSSHRVLDILPLLLRTQPQSKRDAEALALLAKWDGRYEQLSPQPAIYHAFLNTLTDNIYRDELGEAFTTVRNRYPQVVIDAFAGKLNWCDNLQTPKITESCDDLLAPSLHQALNGLAPHYGEDYASWAWGQQLRITHKHLGLGSIPWVGTLLSSETPGQGGPSTPNVAKINSRVLPKIVATSHGPSLRFVTDMLAPDSTRWIISSGQSGHVWSPHYTDLRRLWSEGKYIRIPSQPDPRSITSELRLHPRHNSSLPQ